MRVRERLSSIYWWLPVVIVDIWLVLMSAIFPHLPAFSFKWSLFNPFNLAMEMNLAAWWASASLLLVGLIAYELYSTHERLRTSWLILALIVTGLSLDEFGSIHERAGLVGGWAIYGPAILVGSTMYGYALWQLYKVPTQRRTAVLLAIGMITMGSAVLHEHLEHSVAWPDRLMGLRVGFEEGSELLGTFLCLAALVPQRRLATSNGLCRLIPDPARMVHGRWLLIAAILWQIIVSGLVTFYVEIGPRGDAAVWLPSALFLTLFAFAFWRWLLTAHPAGAIWGMLALYSLALSALMPYAVNIKDTSKLNLLGLASLFPVLFSLFLLGYALLFLRLRRRHRSAWWTFGMSALLLVVSWFGGVWSHYIAAAALAGLMLWYSHRLHFGVEEGTAILPVTTMASRS